MSVIFTVPEVLRLVELGTFTMIGFEAVIPASLADPLAPESKAVIVHVPVKPRERIISERFNWGGTSISGKVTYELRYEQGVYCRGTIRQSNTDNICTHLYLAQFVEVVLWNITSPAADVFVDFSCWYYTFPEANEPEIRKMFFERDRLLTEINQKLEALIRLQKIAPAPLPAPLGA